MHQYIESCAQWFGIKYEAFLYKVEVMLCLKSPASLGCNCQSMKGKSVRLPVLYKPSVSAGICKIYEEHLREWNPQSPSITYDIAQLYDFIDNLYDVSCLV